MSNRITRAVAIACFLLLGQLQIRAADFDFWFPYLYRGASNSSAAWTWIQVNSGTVYYVVAHTNLWDQSLTNGVLVSSNGWMLAKGTNLFVLTYSTNAMTLGGHPWSDVLLLTNGLASTNWVFTWYYPRSNPSNYVTASITNGLWIYTSGTTWVDTVYYPRANPSNYVTAFGMTSSLWLARLWLTNASVSLSTNYDVYEVSGTSTVTLYAATGTGRRHEIDSLGTVTVLPAGSDTINGDTSKLMASNSVMGLTDMASGRWRIW